MKKMELELQLKEARTALGLIEDAKVRARTTLIANEFKSFTAPKGLRVDTHERRIELQMIEDNRYPHTLARFEVDTNYTDDYRTKGYKASYRFNSGDNNQIQFLPAIAEFITIASKSADVICDVFVDLDNGFKDKLMEARKAADAISRQVKDIEYAAEQAKKDAILDLMKGEGYTPLVAKPNKEYGWIKRVALDMKFNWSIPSPVLIKIVSTTASGKSVKVEVSREAYDGSVHTYQPETVRMDNIRAFITRELHLKDSVNENIEDFEILQGVN